MNKKEISKLMKSKQFKISKMTDEIFKEFNAAILIGDTPVADLGDETLSAGLVKGKIPEKKYIERLVRSLVEAMKKDAGVAIVVMAAAAMHADENKEEIKITKIEIPKPKKEEYKS